MIEAGLGIGEDGRWLAPNQSGLACGCGEHHASLFPIHMLAPYGWTGARTYEPDAAVSTDRDFLSENFCCWQGQYFGLRMRLPVRLRGVASACLIYTVWASVSRADFEAQRAVRSGGQKALSAPFQARLVNRINGYPDTAALSGLAFAQDDGGPPLLLIAGPQPGADPRHPLIADQRDGIETPRLLDLYAAYGHDMRLIHSNGTMTTH